MNPIRVVINLSKSKTKLVDFLSLQNNGVRPGSKEFIKQSEQNTLNRLVYLTSKELMEPYVHQFIVKENINGPLSAQDISIDHTKSYIGKLDQRTGKEYHVASISTVKRHLNKLESHGMIKQLRQTGRTSIIIHPDLIEFTEHFTHLEPYFLQFFENSLFDRFNENTAIQNKKGSKWTTKYPSLKTLNNKTVGIVDNSTTQERNLYLDKETFCEETPETEKNLGINEETKKEKVAPKRKSEQFKTYQEYRKHKNKQSKQKDHQGQRQIFIDNSISTIWKWMHENLYQEYDYMAQSQVDFARDFLKNEFENSPKTAPEKFEELQARLFAWKKWIDQEKGRFTALPSSFFDKKTKFGFWNTKKWCESKNKWMQNSKIKAKAAKLHRNYTRLQERTGEYAKLSTSQVIKELKRQQKYLALVKKREYKVYQEWQKLQNQTEKIEMYVKK